MSSHRNRPYRTPLRRSHDQKLRELKAVINLCLFLMQEDFPHNNMDYRDVSNRTGLSVSTIRRLDNETYGLGLRWSTVQAMAHGAGIRVTAHGDGIRLSAAD